MCVNRPEPEPVVEEKAPAVAVAERQQAGDEVDRPGITNGDQEAAVQKEAGKSPSLLSVSSAHCHCRHDHVAPVTAISGTTCHHHQLMSCSSHASHRRLLLVTCCWVCSSASSVGGIMFIKVASSAITFHHCVQQLSMCGNILTWVLVFINWEWIHFICEIVDVVLVWCCLFSLML